MTQNNPNKESKDRRNHCFFFPPITIHLPRTRMTHILEDLTPKMKGQPTNKQMSLGFDRFPLPAGNFESMIFCFSTFVGIWMNHSLEGIYTMDPPKPTILRIDSYLWCFPLLDLFFFLDIFSGTRFHECYGITC